MLRGGLRRAGPWPRHVARASRRVASSSRVSPRFTTPHLSSPSPYLARSRRFARLKTAAGLFFRTFRQRWKPRRAGPSSRPRRRPARRGRRSRPPPSLPRPARTGGARRLAVAQPVRGWRSDIRAARSAAVHREPRRPRKTRWTPLLSRVRFSPDWVYSVLRASSAIVHVVRVSSPRSISRRAVLRAS